MVPTGAMTGAISVTISVTTPNGTAASASNFTVTAAGSPTITSFSPTSGTVGSSVVITGTNFNGTTSVEFDATAATSFTVDSATRITAVVPTGATSGPITVVTPFGTATSTESFTVLLTVHSRAISLGLARHLVARGHVTAADGFSACHASVPVKIRHRVSGVWRTIDSTFTDATGFYRVRIADKPGAYRAKAPKVVIDNDVCARAFSPIAKT